MREAGRRLQRFVAPGGKVTQFYGRLAPELQNFYDATGAGDR
jgi:hypothetical protein